MSEQNHWYQKGLRFKCTECGKCCTGSPGVVWVSLAEMEAMASFLRVSFENFTRQFVRKIGQRYSLVERKKNYDCIFLKESKCEVYGARPTQCKTFPFWPQNLSSEAAWQETAKICEGISEDAPIVPFEKIEEEKLIQIRRNEYGTNS